MILTVSGLWNSGPQHWQTHWERANPSWRRVEHREYEKPARDEWVAELERAITACNEPPILAAHSLGCALVNHWAAVSKLPVRGVFFVAPSDVEAASYPGGPVGFAPMPLLPLPFRSIVVASTNDEYVSMTRARQFAAAWGSELVTVEKAGHLNANSGYGPWPEGAAMLAAFDARLAGRA